ncbi:MAG: DNRLRE domain-containing protein [Verrucomicrobiota bacterium]
MKKKELQDELDRYVEGRLSQQQIDDLELYLDQDAEAKSRFVEYLHLHAVLQADGETLLAENKSSVIEFPASVRWLTAMRYAAAVTFLLGCVWLLRGSFSGEGLNQADRLVAVKIEASEKTPEVKVVEAPKAVTVATLADTRECKWAGSSLPTADGARLGVGKLHLLEGLATVVFDGGAQVTMEAPAVIEVVSAEKCRLLSGGLVGWVRKGAEGFQVETADALVTDYGTRFGVTVGESGRSEVVVLEGEVGVTHSKVEGEKRLKMGEAARYDAASFLPGKKNSASEANRNSGKAGLSVKKQGSGWKVISTSEGKGKDVYVRQGDTGGPFGRRPLVMAKRSPDRETNQRKIYLGFDLNRLKRAGISEAELVLEIRSSGLGYASLVPDAKFTVYGLTDEDLDGWDEHNLTWNEAPANVITDGSRLDENKVIEVGRFEIKQGVASGFRSVAGETLGEFLNNDSNGMATLIIVRETEQTAGNGLVHAFASREHPSAMAPTLRIKLAK